MAYDRNGVKTAKFDPEKWDKTVCDVRKRLRDEVERDAEKNKELYDAEIESFEKSVNVRVIRGELPKNRWRSHKKGKGRRK